MKTRGVAAVRFRATATRWLAQGAILLPILLAACGGGDGGGGPAY